MNAKLIRDNLSNLLVKIKHMDVQHRWQIQDFSEWGAPTYHLVNFLRNLHGNERLWTEGRASVATPPPSPSTLDSPTTMD